MMGVMEEIADTKAPMWAIAVAKVIAEDIGLSTYEHSTLTIARAISLAADGKWSPARQARDPGVNDE